MKKGNPISILACLLAFSLVLSSCGSTGGSQAAATTTSGSSSKSATPKIFNWSQLSPIGTLNPHTTEKAIEVEIIDLLQAYLYQWKPSKDGKSGYLDANLALEKPTASADGSTWQIKINPKAKWSNGDPINADTFMYSWKMALDPKMLNSPGGTTCGTNYIKVENAMAYYTQVSTGKPVTWEAVGFKKVDEYTVSIKTEGKFTQQEVMQHFAWRTTGPVYEKLYEAGMDASKLTTRYGTDIDKFVCSGPFILKTWSKGSEHILEKNTNYLHTENTKLDGMRVRVVADEGTKMQLFEKGELDYILLATSSLDKYAEDPRVKTFDSALIRDIEINRTNPDKPILHNKNFLKAMFYAMDRTAMAKLVYGIPSPFIVSTRSMALDDGTKFRDLPGAKAYLAPNNGYNPTLAKELFDKALVEEKLTKVSLQLLYTDATEATRILSEYMQKKLPELFGADKFELKLQATTTGLDIMKASLKTQPNSYDLCWIGWNLGAESFSPASKFQLYLSDSSRRCANYGNKQIDTLYAQALSDEIRGDKKKVAELAMEMEKTFLEEVLNIPIFQVTSYAMYANRVALSVNSNYPGIGWGWEFMDIKS